MTGMLLQFWLFGPGASICSAVTTIRAVVRHVCPPVRDAQLFHANFARNRHETKRLTQVTRNVRPGVFFFFKGQIMKSFGSISLTTR